MNKATSFDVWLRSGEQILWTDKSHQEFGFKLFAVPIIIVGLLAVIGIWNQLYSGHVNIVGFVQCLIVAVTFFEGAVLVYFLAGRHYREQTFYAVTNQRVLFRGGMNNVERSLDLRDLPEMRLQVRDDGRGRIIFRESERSISNLGNGALFIIMDGFDPSFENIENAREVYDLIQHAKQEIK